MAIFKKQSVAWAITAVMIVLAIFIGLNKNVSRTPEPAPPSGTDGYNPTITMYIHDDAGVLSKTTENKLAERIAGLINRYNAAIAVVTCNYGGDLYSFALDYAEDIGLSGNDFIIVLDISGENYWLLQGANLIDAFSDQDCSNYASSYMERDFAAGDYDGAVLALTDALADWYQAHF